jgi:proteic killer suppression protein
VASNKLSVLDGDRAGLHCICINEHGRICFKWKAGHAYDVEIFGYH